MNDPEGELQALLPRLLRESRIHFLDNLRSFLIVLVILHHAALPYSALVAVFWPYKSPYHVWRFSQAIITLFVALNQTFFMGLLFFLAGHFSSIAIERKSYRAFCVDRLKRLGIPMVVYTLLVHPILLILVEWAHRGSIGSALKNYYLHLNGVRGPIWFIATLLAFDLIYASIHLIVPSFKYLIPTTQTQYRAAVILGIGAVIMTSFFLRLSHPIGRTLPPLEVELAYTPQYVFAYIAGTSMSKTQIWILTPDPRRALLLSYLGAIAALGIASLIFGPSAGYAGGWSFVALFYAVFNEVCFYFIGRAWYSFFHDSEYTTQRWKNTARYSYGAYLVHSLVVVGLQILVDGAVGGALDGLFKAIIVGGLAVLGSWALAVVLISIPFVGRII
uniref:Acyltransferase 3 n=1 Tax=Mycena chlorophos TaxID=658473 RepID=A0ABQ0LCD6_MYCCL|nr:acyltransferase 3 [Mycena chlorophos]